MTKATNRQQNPYKKCKLLKSPSCSLFALYFRDFIFIFVISNLSNKHSLTQRRKLGQPG